MINPSQQPLQAPGVQNAGFAAPLAKPNDKALGSYRQDIAYTGALKSTYTVTQRQGSYRDDIAYTAALKSEQNSQAGNAFVSNNAAAHADTLQSNHPKFAGANKLLAPVLFSAPFVAGFSAISQSNSMLGIAARDALDSSGRVYQEFKRDKHGGRESLLEEFATTVIWGFGIPTLTKSYDFIVSRMSAQGKKPAVHFPGMDLSILQDKSAHQKLTKETVETYFKNYDSLPKETFEAQKKQLLALIENGEAGQKLLSKYRGSQLAKLVLCTFLPVAAIGFGIPKANQWLTHKKIHQEHERQMMQGLVAPEKAEGQAQQQAENPFRPFPQGDVLRMAAYQQNGAPGMSQANYEQAALKFGFAKSASNLVGNFLQNEKMTSLAFVDTPLSSGRVITARNKDERIERLYREAVIIATLFWLQGAIQNVISKGMDKTLGTATDVEMKSLKHLQNKYKASADAEQQFLKDYAELKKSLGVSKNGLLAEHADNAETMVNGIRDYFSNPVKTPNLLYDLAEVGGKVPTVALKNNPAMAKRIDITQKIDESGVKTVAEYLDKLAKEVAGKPGKLGQTLTKTAGAKVSAFGLSALACWAVVSMFLPKSMHAITKYRTGRDQFPGIENINYS